MITADDFLAHEFQVTLPMGPGHVPHWHCACGERGTVKSIFDRRKAHAEHATEALNRLARSRVATVLVEKISDDPMWDGIDYTAQREAAISNFVDSVVEAL